MSSAIDENLDKDVDELSLLLLAAQEADQIPTENRKSIIPHLKEDPSFEAAFGSSSPSLSLTLNVVKSNKEPATNIEDFDSSDDEEVKNFLQRKYNEYGCDINKNLKQIVQEKKEAVIEQEIRSSSSGGQSGTPSNTSQLTRSFAEIVKRESISKPNPIRIEPKATIFTDPIFALRLVNPLVSSAVLSDRMSGRIPISFAGLTFHIQRGDLSKDWVIAGAIISKSPVKTSKKGALYSIWRLSDLKGDIKTVSVFLFKNAHKDLWKTAQGMVVAILNPGIFDKREERSDVACLSIDSSQKVMILGQSKDFGICKSKKKNGDPCGAVVNSGDCEFCVFHVKQEFGKMSKRSELQSSTAGRGLQELRNKVLGKSEVFYGGQSFTAIPAKKSAKQTAKDQNRLQTLSEYFQSPNSGAAVNHISRPKTKGLNPPVVPYAAKTGHISKVAGTVEATTKQRQQDLERLKILRGETANCSVQLPQINTVPELPQFSFMQKTPSLGKDSFSFEIDLSAKKANQSKLKAMDILKKKPLMKSNPNFVKYRGTSDGKRRAIDVLNSVDENTKKRRIEEDQEKAKLSRIQKIMGATSSHTNLIKIRENEEQDKYFNKLEKKEALEEKMLNTFKVPCKAVICVQCKYTAFSASDRCKEEKHSLKVVDAEKRFFQCLDCGYRTASVHKIPKMSCKSCCSSRWQRAAMIREKKTFNPSANLSIRGDEETFLGSLQANGNFNLLVPE